MQLKSISKYKEFEYLMHYSNDTRIKNQQYSF